MTQSARHNLPSQPTSFIGRAYEIDELVELLSRPDCRLVTLVGSGGIGKTRLAVETAHRLISDFAHGVYFVPLTPLESPLEVIPTIINVLGVHIGSEGTSQEELLKFMSKRQLLLLMDNFEHLMESASFISELIDIAPDVKVIVTSREVLNLQEEWVWQVKGLNFPESQHSNGHYLGDEFSAIRLFVDRAARLNRSFSVEENQQDMVRICQLVEGMPLAIELAVSWLKTLTCKEIVTEIKESIDFLASKYRNVSQRHRSMRAVFDHSWQLCTPQERDVFMRLCVFHGGFEREAAEQVAGASLRILSTLVEKSMLRKLPSGRYDIQELLRQYAAEQLHNSGQTEAIRDAHMEHYAGFVGAITPDIKGRRQIEALDEVEADFDNIRVAWNRAVEQANYDHLDAIMEGLALFCDMRARYQAGEILFRNAIEHLSVLNTEEIHPTYNRLRVYDVFVFALKGKAADDAIQQQLADSLAYAETQQDANTVGLCLFLQGELCKIEDGYSGKASSIPYFERALKHYQQLEDAFYYIGRVLRGLVFSLHVSGHTLDESTNALNKQHCDLTEGIGDLNGLGHALLYNTHYGTREEKDGRFRNTINLMRKTGDWKSVGITQYLHAELIMLGGGIEAAHLMMEEAQQMMEDCGWAEVRWTDVTRGVNSALRGDDAAMDLLLPDYVDAYNLIEHHIEVTSMIKVLGYAMLSLLGDKHPDHLLRMGIETALACDVPSTAAGCITVIAMILAKNGETTKATELIGLAHTQSEDLAMGWIHHWQALLDVQARLEAELGTAVYHSAWKRGESLDLRATLKDLLIYFGGEPRDHALSNGHDQDALTERELEVLRLVAQGYTNREIAENLTVVIGTIKTHLHNTCQKLGASNRTQAVAIARELNIISDRV